MTDQTSTPDLEGAADDNRPDGAAGQRPPGSNQRSAEPPAAGTTESADAPEETDADQPKGIERPDAGVFRPSAPSGEVSPH